MPIVHVMTGLPASGKTTFARLLDAMRFSLDDYRSMMGIGKETWSHEKEQVAVAGMIDSARAALRAGYDIVCDNTHLVPRLPKLYKREFGPFDVTFEVHDFTDVTIAECIDRDSERVVGHVGPEVIQKLAARHAEARKNNWRLTDKWMNGEAYVSPGLYVPNVMLPTAIVCDIDGTVALNDGHRGHYEYEKVLGDKPIANVIRFVQELQEMTEVIFVSGRKDSCREDTETWLMKHGLSDGTSILLMRSSDDNRPDFVIKVELFDAFIRHHFNVLATIDDRNQVVQKAWRAMGLLCCQVAEGAF